MYNNLNVATSESLAVVVEVDVVVVVGTTVVVVVCFFKVDVLPDPVVCVLKLDSSNEKILSFKLSVTSENKSSVG